MTEQGNGAGGTRQPESFQFEDGTVWLRLPQSVRDEVGCLLNIRDEAALDRLAATIFMLTISYEAGRDISAKSPRGAAERKTIKKIASHLSSISEALDKLHPATTVRLFASLAVASPHEFRIPERPEREPQEAQKFIEALTEAAEWFAGILSTRRGPRGNEPLNDLIGSLMVLFERVTGKRARAQAATNGEVDAHLSSPEAKAIGRVVQFCEPEQTDDLVVYRINQINAAYPGPMLAEQFTPLLDAGHAGWIVRIFDPPQPK